jgi:DNA-directed RNA polymerase specialized sigma subunit
LATEGVLRHGGQHHPRAIKKPIAPVFQTTSQIGLRSERRKSSLENYKREEQYNMNWRELTQRVYGGVFDVEPTIEQIARIQECFKTLPSVEQQILNLYFAEKTPTHQIAAELNLSIREVRCMRKRAFYRMQKLTSNL